MAGVISSVVMMTVIRNSQFAALGAIVLVFALLGAVALFLSQRGKAQRTRRTQRERYLEYLEELRDERRRAGAAPAVPAARSTARGLVRLGTQSGTIVGAAPPIPGLPAGTGGLWGLTSAGAGGRAEQRGRVRPCRTRSGRRPRPEPCRTGSPRQRTSPSPCPWTGRATSASSGTARVCCGWLARCWSRRRSRAGRRGRRARHTRRPADRAGVGQVAAPRTRSGPA